ncbi:MAG: hypothetical protein HKO66_04240 [Saprospiraceae bacterium]|nr:hypothetical protein [Bacteroidia bacterium]NNE15341.1 hypothetical protein [Saprospiraceae bacterium]NNL91421.1 hypothetical protein [Saprospiraceae bacterium]
MKLKNLKYILLILLFCSCGKNSSQSASDACELISLSELMEIFNNFSSATCTPILDELEPNVTLCSNNCWEDQLTGYDYTFEFVFYKDANEVDSNINLEAYLKEAFSLAKQIEEVNNSMIFAKLGNYYRYCAFKNETSVVIIDFGARQLEENEIKSKIMEVANKILDRI